jgi:hypothetical protein
MTSLPLGGMASDTITKQALDLANFGVSFLPNGWWRVRAAGGMLLCPPRLGTWSGYAHRVGGKRLGLLHELLPSVSFVAMLVLIRS